jgi:hypothetical protein
MNCALMVALSSHTHTRCPQGIAASSDASLACLYEEEDRERGRGKERREEE